jgi:hypothetical protein
MDEIAHPFGLEGYPLEVMMPQGLNAGGAILSDRAKCPNRRSRKAGLICGLPQPGRHCSRSEDVSSGQG